jgi:hypothetical protein
VQQTLQKCHRVSNSIGWCEGEGVQFVAVENEILQDSVPSLGGARCQPAAEAQAQAKPSQPHAVSLQGTVAAAVSALEMSH